MPNSLFIGGIIMSISAIVSIIIGIASLILAFIFEGGKVGSLFQYTSALIVFGGTIGAVGLSFPAEDLKRVFSIFKVAFRKNKSRYDELIIFFRDIAIKSRKNGLLSLEEEISRKDGMEPFIAKGLQMIVDGIDPETVKSTLEAEAYITFERHKSGIAIFESAGGFAPTMGIIGTVMGLVHVLSNLDDPQTLGPKIAVAFIATLYGVASANLLWLPIANKLKALNKKEQMEKELIIDAVISIQEGINPNVLVEKLICFVEKNNDKPLGNSEEKQPVSING